MSLCSNCSYARSHCCSRVLDLYGRRPSNPKAMRSGRGNPVPLLNLAEFRRACPRRAMRRGLMKEIGLCAETGERGESMRQATYCMYAGLYLGDKELVEKITTVRVRKSILIVFSYRSISRTIDQWTIDLYRRPMCSLLSLKHSRKKLTSCQRTFL